MKNLLLFVFSFTAGVMLVYLGVAFVFFDLDPSVWTRDARLSVTLVGSLTGVVFYWASILPSFKETL